MLSNQMNRIAVCDDLPEDRSALMALLREYLDLHEYSTPVDEFPSGEGFLNADLSQYDLVILDIFMGELSGIETARRLAESYPGMQIIFCSTSNAYAAESYDVDALRYLTKPVERSKLFATLDRFFQARRAMRTLTFKRNRMDEQVYLSEILWIETRDHKCIIHTSHGALETRTPFTQLQEQLKDADFIKPIRYALVSLAAVSAIPTDVVTLKNGERIPISRDYRTQMRTEFTNYKMRCLLRRGGGTP